MEKYKHFFKNNLDLACFANLGGYFEELNKNFTKVLGYNRKDLLNKKFLEFIHADDVEPTLIVLEKLSLGLSTSNFITRFRSKRGTYRYLEWSSVLNPETRKIYAIARDVTEQIIAYKELGFQSEEKEKRAAELIIANKELIFQNKEKGKRAEELTFANKKLAFENDEKEKRAAELVIANKELAYQNKEKEKRAAELIVANKELVFQSKEKENRAAELVLLNDELLKAERNNTKYIKGLEEMMFMTSHRVRQPVANIIGLAQLFEQSINSPAETKKLVSFIKQSAEALETFTRDLTVLMQELSTKNKAITSRKAPPVRDL